MNPYSEVSVQPIVFDTGNFLCFKSGSVLKRACTSLWLLRSSAGAVSSSRFLLSPRWQGEGGLGMFEDVEPVTLVSY